MAEDYDRASTDYARIRRPIGIEILLGTYIYHLGHLADRMLLDVGAGPGNYSVALARYFGTVVGIDSAESQVKNARIQAAQLGLDNHVTFTVADALDLPIDNASVDAVLMSFVIHHIPASEHRRAIAELARVLKPGGVAVLGVATRDQVFDSAWYLHLFREISEISSRRHPDPDALTAIAADNGLTSAGRFVPVDGLLQGPEYFNATGPADEAWRHSDSVFSLMSPVRIAALEEQVHAMEADGTIETYMRENDRARQNVGQVTFMTFTKAE